MAVAPYKIMLEGHKSASPEVRLNPWTDKDLVPVGNY